MTKAANRVGTALPARSDRDGGTIGFVGDDAALVAALKKQHKGAIAAFHDRYAEHMLRILCTSLPVQATETPGIVVIGGGDALALQIRAELVSLGFRVHVVDDSGLEPQTAIDAHSAQAAVRVTAPGGRIEVWLVDPASGAVRLREVLYIEHDAASGDPIAAVQVVELLRASLVELPMPRTQSHKTATAPANSPPTAPTAEPPVAHQWSDAPREPEATQAFRLAVGGGVNASLGVRAPSPGISLTAFWQPIRRVSVGLSSLIPVTSIPLAEDEGEAEITTWSLAAAARVEPWLTLNRVSPFLQAGLSAAVFHVEGIRAADSYALRSDQLVVLGPELQLGLRWSFSKRLSLLPSAGAAVYFPKPVVRFASRPVATLGRPLLMAALALEYRAVWTRSRN